MTSEWPTYEEAENLAKAASKAGLSLKMQERKNGWSWTWLHTVSGITFEGTTTARPKAVALVIALQGAPIVAQS